jgi:extracellular matrix regulatory protein A
VAQSQNGGTELVHVGFGHFLAIDKILALANMSKGTAPIQRLVRDAKRRGNIIDMTTGRKTKTAVITQSGHIVLLAITPEAVAGRVSGRTTRESVADGE